MAKFRCRDFSLGVLRASSKKKKKELGDNSVEKNKQVDLCIG